MIKWKLKQVDGNGYLFEGTLPIAPKPPIYVKVKEEMVSDYLNSKYEDDITKILLTETLNREFNKMRK